ncbi:sulfotransferase family 2 domain-containing protein [Vibrio cholerae]|uniref:sulfotransferase family 2 domain-containing protein n=1 Tax=Vibrio cholerae TaxID=666 RepID=UPI0029DA9A23|nr:hypothetical protein [Vibrio cholerae]
MLVNKEKGFIFIHIWKTGGTSIRESLKIVENSENYDCRKYKHISALKARDLLGSETYNKLHSFSVVRNPWDLQVSNYFYARQRKEHYFHDFMMRFKCFDEYIEWRCTDGFEPQISMLTDNNKKIIVDSILRFESLDVEFNQICANIGIKLNLNKLNTSKHDYYKNYYSDFSKKLIESSFKCDIDAFGYQW